LGEDVPGRVAVVFRWGLHGVAAARSYEGRGEGAGADTAGAFRAQGVHGGIGVDVGLRCLGDDRDGDGTGDRGAKVPIAGEAGVHHVQVAVVVGAEHDVAAGADRRVGANVSLGREVGRDDTGGAGDGDVAAGGDPSGTGDGEQALMRDSAHQDVFRRVGRPRGGEVGLGTLGENLHVHAGAKAGDANADRHRTGRVLDRAVVGGQQVDVLGRPRAAV